MPLSFGGLAASVKIAKTSVAATPSSRSARNLLSPPSPQAFPPPSCRPAATDAVTATSALATPPYGAAKDLLPPLLRPFLATKSNVRVPAAPLVANVTVAVSSLAAAPAGGVPAAASSTTHAFRAETAFLWPAASPVATFAAASAVTYAIAADKTVDGVLRVTVQEALNPESCCWVLLPIDVPEDLLNAVCNGAPPAAEAAQPIFNSQLLARMLELGDSADRG